MLKKARGVNNKAKFAIWLRILDSEFQLPRCRNGLASQNDCKIDIFGNPISESAAYFFSIILLFIFNPLLELKFLEKYLDAKTFHFRINI